MVRTEETATTNTTAKEKLTEQKSLKKAAATLDSTISSYSVLIKPTGSFSYSEANGFNGNATYVMLRGQSSKLQKTMQQEQLRQVRQKETTHEQVQKEKLKLNEKLVLTKKTGAKWLYLLLLLPLAGLGYRYRKKLKLIFITSR